MMMMMIVASDKLGLKSPLIFKDIEINRTRMFCQSLQETLKTASKIPAKIQDTSPEFF